MSNTVVKTTYLDDDGCGGTTRHVLYAKHSSGCDRIAIYDGDGKMLFSFCDTQKNNILVAIEKLCNLNSDYSLFQEDEEATIEYVSLSESKVLEP